MILRNFVILSFCAIFLACSNDEKIKSDNTQNQNPDKIVMYMENTLRDYYLTHPQNTI